MTEGSDPVFTRHRFPGFRSAVFYARRWRWAILAFAVRNGGKLTKM